jgi:hypothetical protein
MMIIQLPPEPVEKQLTATAPIRHLAEHKEFFLILITRTLGSMKSSINSITIS